MKNKIKKKLSLRVRVTLIAALVLIIVCLLLSGIILKNAQIFIISPAHTLTAVNSEDLLNEKEDIFFDSTQGAISINEKSVNVFDFYKYTLISIIVAVVAGIILIYIVIGFALKPLKQLSTNITNISTDDLSNRIEEFSASDELANLAQSFNKLLDRIENAFIREKVFPQERRTN